MTPAQDGAWQGKADAQRDAEDAGAACSNYNGTASNQCYNAYYSAFNETCSHLHFTYDPYPEYAQCPNVKH
jgi:hypothetical protein